MATLKTVETGYCIQALVKVTACTTPAIFLSKRTETNTSRKNSSVNLRMKEKGKEHEINLFSGKSDSVMVLQKLELLIRRVHLRTKGTFYMVKI